MRTITFDTENEQHGEAFVILHQGFLMGQPEGGLKGISARRTVVKVLDKMDAISIPVKQTDPETGEEQVLRYQATMDEMRQLRNGGGAVDLALEDAEFDLLKACWETAMPQFKTGASRQVVRVADMIDGAS